MDIKNFACVAGLFLLIMFALFSFILAAEWVEATYITPIKLEHYRR